MLEFHCKHSRHPQAARPTHYPERKNHSFVTFLVHWRPASCCVCPERPVPALYVPRHAQSAQGHWSRLVPVSTCRQRGGTTFLTRVTQRLVSLLSFGAADHMIGFRKACHEYFGFVTKPTRNSRRWMVVPRRVTGRYGARFIARSSVSLRHKHTPSSSSET